MKKKIPEHESTENVPSFPPGKEIQCGANLLLAMYLEISAIAAHCGTAVQILKDFDGKYDNGGETLSSEIESAEAHLCGAVNDISDGLAAMLRIAGKHGEKLIICGLPDNPA